MPLWKGADSDRGERIEADGRSSRAESSRSRLPRTFQWEDSLLLVRKSSFLFKTNRLKVPATNNVQSCMIQTADALEWSHCGRLGFSLRIFRRSGFDQARLSQSERISGHAGGACKTLGLIVHCTIKNFFLGSPMFV